MDVKLHAKIQYNLSRLNSTISKDLVVHYSWKIWACPDIPGHTQLNQCNDPFVPCMDVSLHENNQYGSSNLSRNIGNLLFQRTLDMSGHAWPHLRKIIWSNHRFHEGFTICKKTNTITRPFLEILVICYFLTQWKGVPGHAWPYSTWIMSSNVTLHECNSNSKII